MTKYMIINNAQTFLQCIIIAPFYIVHHHLFTMYINTEYHIIGSFFTNENNVNMVQKVQTVA